MAYKDDVISLIAKTYTITDYGDVTATESTRDVFADVRSVGMREKYEALQAGLNPELVFVLADYEEYEGEDEIDYDDERYRVIRTYRNGQTLEITVTRDASVPEPEPPTPDPSNPDDPAPEPEDDNGGTQSD